MLTRLDCNLLFSQFFLFTAQHELIATLVFLPVSAVSVNVSSLFLFVYLTILMHVEHGYSIVCSSSEN